MKKISFILLIVILCGTNLSAKPIAGITSISWNTKRGMTISSLLEQHIISILKKTDAFDTIDPGIINRELSKFSCFDEKCITDFASNAGISLIINGNIQDRESYLNITLRSYGVNRVMNRKLIYSSTVKIPLDVPIGSREFSLLCEEHSSKFIVKTLNSFRQDVSIVKEADSYSTAPDMKITGRFPLYRKADSGSIKKYSEIVLSDGRVTDPGAAEISPDSFVIIDFKKQAMDADIYYTNTKSKIIFPQTSFYDTLYMILLTPFASVSMPVSSPFLGYYMNNDWQGLGLWMVSASPYLYIEARGLINSPSKLKEENQDISRDDRAMNYFAWYMAAAGGLPLFIDSYVHSYLQKASYFNGSPRLLGNNATALYLSLATNGGGMFYKGKRGWGYFYFHLNNILLYSTIRDFSIPEEFNPVTGSYEKGGNNSGRGKILAGILASSKIIEAVHTLTSRESLESGILQDEYIIPEPVFTFDHNNEPVYALSVTLRY